MTQAIIIHVESDESGVVISLCCCFADTVCDNKDCIENNLVRRKQQSITSKCAAVWLVVKNAIEAINFDTVQ